MEKRQNNILYDSYWVIGDKIEFNWDVIIGTMSQEQQIYRKEDEIWL